ncbi:hypothetical protein BDV93DRAFT_602968 [Ceratobasidium sp. AG-I]|nr:hypothetical protein BDV93DRAFT_602968 [Ceratobasidium sp. AG-I]
MYLAGLSISITEAQALNALSWATTVLWFRISRPDPKFRELASREAGPVKSMPPNGQGLLVSKIASHSIFAPVGVFVLSLPVVLFADPKWLAVARLPPISSRELYIGLRVAACASTFIGIGIGKAVFRHLGSQLGMIGIRERPKVVKTGPYAVVRHPGYSTVLAQQLLFVAMFWNWTFAAAFVVSAVSYGIKMPIEEKVMEESDEIGDAYRQYKREVPYRVIPYIW